MLWNLAKEFTNRCDLRTFGLKLLPESEVATSLANHQHSIHEAAYGILRQWRASQENESDAYKKICEALRDARQNLLISKVLQ